MKKALWTVVNIIILLFLLVVACGPGAVAPTPVTSPTPLTSPAPEIPTAPVAPTTTPGKENLTPGVEMVKLSLKKLDGTVVEKLVEKPKYGGVFVMSKSSDILGFDEAFLPESRLTTIFLTNEKLVDYDFKRGPSSTRETSFFIGGDFTPNVATGDLAESWEIVDDNTIIFHIRKGVHWALNPNSEASKLVAGRELNADDVVFSLKYVWENPRSLFLAS